jgi:uncharacterized membrane protein (GlpM family)
MMVLILVKKIILKTSRDIDEIRFRVVEGNKNIPPSFIFVINMPKIQMSIK